MKRWLMLAVPALVAGCAQDDYADLRQFMDEAGKNQAAKVEPLPALKPVDTFVYQSGQLPDPFSAGGLRPGQEDLMKGEAGRPREALEDYPLESLRVAGVIQKGGAYHALIATPENRLHLAKKGTRIGQNGGVITDVHSKGIEVKERVRNSLGKWVEAKTSLLKQTDGDVQAINPGKPGN